MSYPTRVRMRRTDTTSLARACPKAHTPAKAVDGEHVGLAAHTGPALRGLHTNPRPLLDTARLASYFTIPSISYRVGWEMEQLTATLGSQLPVPAVPVAGLRVTVLLFIVLSQAVSLISHLFG